MTRPSVPGRSASAHRLAIEVARGRLSTVVDGVQEQPVLLTRRGRPVAAVITVEQYEMLLAAEERLRRRTRLAAASDAMVMVGDDGHGDPRRDG